MASDFPDVIGRQPKQNEKIIPISPAAFDPARMMWDDVKQQAYLVVPDGTAELEAERRRKQIERLAAEKARNYAGFASGG
jgi:hypothetical protein